MQDWKSIARSLGNPFFSFKHGAEISFFFCQTTSIYRSIASFWYPFFSLPIGENGEHQTENDTRNCFIRTEPYSDMDRNTIIHIEKIKRIYVTALA